MMWTVKVDSNVPIKAVTTNGSGGFTSDRFLKEYQKEGDVEKLLGSQSPMRARSSSLRGRPPLPTHTPTRSQSPSSISRRQAYSIDAIIAKASKDQQHQTLGPTIDAYDTNSTGQRHDTKSDVMLQSTAYGKYGITGSPQTPFRADHNMPTSLLESCNGISPSTTQSGKLTTDNLKSGNTYRLNRSSSLSRLNRSTNGQSILLTDNHCGSDIRYEDVSEIQRALEESELQRRVLMQQQKAAQATLQLHSERMSKIASSVDDNNVLVENLKLKEKQYHNLFKQLQASEQEKQILQAKNLRLQEDMQNRINDLDYQLRHLKSQHHSTENNNNKNITLLDHTTTALSFMEEKNSKLQQDKETLQSEISLVKEFLDVAKTRYGALDDDNRNMRNESVKLKEVNSTLSRKVQEIAGQMIELHSLLKAVKDENERLISTLKTYTQDKSSTVKQIQGYQDTISHLKIRLSAASADRDRLFQEKLDMNSKLQQMLFDKEHLMKTQLILDDQLNEQMSQHVYTKASEFKLKMKEIDLPKEPVSVKKEVKEELSTELTLLKDLYKQALEQIAVLDWDKSVLQSQCDLSNQERFQHQQDVNTLSQESVRNKQQSAKNHLTSTESEKLHEEFEKLQLEYNKLKDENSSLVAKTQQLEHYGGVEEKAELEMIKLKKEKDAVQKQVAFLQGQIMLLEGSKRRADEQVFKLTSEVGELQVKLKENSKRNSSPEEERSIRQEVEMLKLQLSKAKEDQQIQHTFIESLREKTVSDERLELQQLKDKLHELFRETEQKNRTIDSLKFDLKSLKEVAEAKQMEVQELYKVMEEIKSENQMLQQNIQVVPNSVGVVPQQQEQQTSKQQKAVRTQKEELLEVVNTKQDSCDKGDNTRLSSSWNLQSTNDVPISHAENSLHLHNVKSYHHTKGDDEVTPLQQTPNSLTKAEPSKLFSKSWAPAPKWQINAAGSSVDIAATSQEANTSSMGKSLKPARKLPPPPPPKPMLNTTTSSSSSENTGRGMDVVSSAFDIITSESSSVKWPSLSSASTSTSLSSSGLDQNTFSTENHDESHKQGNINVLILKFEEMASF